MKSGFCHNYICCLLLHFRSGWSMYHLLSSERIHVLIHASFSLVIRPTQGLIQQAWLWLVTHVYLEPISGRWESMELLWNKLRLSLKLGRVSFSKIPYLCYAEINGFWCKIRKARMLEGNQVTTEEPWARMRDMDAYFQAQDFTQLGQYVQVLLQVPPILLLLSS